MSPRSPSSSGTAARSEAADSLPVSPDATAARETDLTPLVGSNVRRLRVKRGLSLERLSKASGVSRGMLGQIELGQSTPTINVLWKIALALGVPFSTLLARDVAPATEVLPAANARRLTSSDGSFSSRALFPFTHGRVTEFYELRLAPGGVERAEPHPPGTTENLVVSQGVIDIKVDGVHRRLEENDAIFFQADVPHEYANHGNNTGIMYLVMRYADQAVAAKGRPKNILDR